MGIHVVVGGQYGSEAKGHVTDQVIRRLQREAPDEIFNIRVGGPNAGHTVYDGEGNKFPLRQVPVGAVRGVTVLIGPGSEIDLAVLYSELALLREAGHRPSLGVHSEVTILTDDHKDAEADADLHQKIGSTGKGIGAARASRIMRKALVVRNMPVAAQDGLDVAGVEVIYPADWTRLVNTAAATGQVVIEGVQGYGLGLHAGHYPQSTTSDSTAVDFLSAAGLSPWVTDEPAVIVVAREYPIRVAGNSGPLFNETTWEKLGLPEERTTVTQKVRRVGHWDPDLIRRAVAANGGAPVAVVVLTMVDQKFPHLKEVQSVNWHDLGEQIGARHPVWQHLKNVERDAGTTVVGFTTSPTTIAWL